MGSGFMPDDDGDVVLVADAQVGGEAAGHAVVPAALPIAGDEPAEAHLLLHGLDEVQGLLGQCQ